jgi:hypothetical protein
MPLVGLVIDTAAWSNGLDVSAQAGGHWREFPGVDEAKLRPASSNGQCR